MHNPINGLAAYCERKKEKKVKGITLPAIDKVSRETRTSEALGPSMGLLGPKGLLAPTNSRGAPNPQGFSDQMLLEAHYIPVFKRTRQVGT